MASLCCLSLASWIQTYYKKEVTYLVIMFNNSHSQTDLLVKSILCTLMVQVPVCNHTSLYSSPILFSVLSFALCQHFTISHIKWEKWEKAVTALIPLPTLATMIYWAWAAVYPYPVRNGAGERKHVQLPRKQPQEMMMSVNYYVSSARRIISWQKV